jgi:hypothetical protein
MLLPHLSDEHGKHYLGAYTAGFTLWFCVCSMSCCAPASTSLWLTVNQPDHPLQRAFVRASEVEAWAVGRSARVR